MPSFRQLSHYYRNRIPNNSNIEQQYFWEGFTNQANIGLVKSALGDIYEGFIAGNEIPGKGDEVAFIPGIPIGQIYVRQFVQPEIISVVEPVPRFQGNCFFVLSSEGINQRYYLQISGAESSFEVITLDPGDFGARPVRLAGSPNGSWVAIFQTSAVGADDVEFTVINGNREGVLNSATFTYSYGLTPFPGQEISGDIRSAAYPYIIGVTFETGPQIPPDFSERERRQIWYLYNLTSQSNSSTDTGIFITATSVFPVDPSGTDYSTQNGIHRDGMNFDGIIDSSTFAQSDGTFSTISFPDGRRIDTRGWSTTWNERNILYTAEQRGLNNLWYVFQDDFDVDNLIVTESAEPDIGPIALPALPAGSWSPQSWRYYST